MTFQDPDYMRLALDEARSAFLKGEVPVGAVLVRDDGAILSRGHNLRESLSDPTAHAELRVIQEASRQLDHWRLSGLTLYVTLEPCPMCAGAILQARIPRLVFGCLDPKAGACGSLLNLPEDSRFNHRVRVEKGCLEGECSSLLREFFAVLRETRKASRFRPVRMFQNHDTRY